ncbi:hypothetical protein FRX31_034417 [Thalictrum thalictroides]|uniref:Uncharacterized protein n=1 Tax=Thalictrum thalictroides TaxID=46969 RepID=A0A7J6UTV0_THATH|nr:hypothetical protein FRX31_034417 [Thalictrum thalictroides]
MSIVRIIHAGGLVELYHDAVTAFEVMEKYPGMHLSRPDIFRQPHESILHPYEKLLPGQKFYLVPSTTVRKLKRKHRKKPQETIIDTSSEDTVLEKNAVNEGGDDLEDTFCSAKDFFVAREKWARYALWKCDREVTKPFRPPIRKPRMWKGLGWQPSLTAIKELSP